MQEARDRDVVQVVARKLGGGAVLPVSRYMRDNEIRTGFTQHVRPEPEACQLTRTKIFHHGVALCSEAEYNLFRLGVLQIQGDA